MASGNADQVDYWNTVAGPKWARRAVDLDTLNAEVVDVLVGVSRARTGERVLDIGCGAGATTLAFAVIVGETGRALGLDLSRPLLDVAEERKRTAGLTNLGFLEADAALYPLPENAFDVAVSRFGIMFFSNPEAAFENIARALVPGGRIAFAAWASLERNPWFSVPRATAEARLGPVPPGPSDAPGPFAFADIDRAVRLLRSAGLSDAAGEARAITLHHPGGAAAVADLGLEIGPIPGIVREKGGGDADLAAIRQALADALVRYEGPDGIRIPAEINLFTAARA